MHIAEFLSPDDVAVNTRAADKERLLQELAAQAAVKVKQPAKTIATELLKREQLGALACVARELRAPERVAKLRRAKTAADLYSALTGIFKKKC